MGLPACGLGGRPTCVRILLLVPEQACIRPFVGRLPAVRPTVSMSPPIISVNQPSQFMNEKQYQEITILIPGYSIEDLPTELPEPAAASLLNAFSVAWHPILLQQSHAMPQFRQAEATELPTGRQIVLVPEPSVDWMGHDWYEQIENTGSLILHDCSDRTQWLEKISEHLPVDRLPDPSVVQDFLALGTSYLQVMLLSRRMHYFVDPDTFLLESEAMAAAEAAFSGQPEQCRDHLRRAFECLLDCREQFQPTDCFLMDFCLPSDQSKTEELAELIQSSSELTLILSGSELQRHWTASPAFQEAVTAAVADKRLSLMSGHQWELRTTLSSLSALYSDLAGLEQWRQEQLPDAERHWARKRFGMTSTLPAILSLFGFRSALHVVLDDGLYPDREQGQMQWQAPDGSTIAATSRIPVAIDGAASFLRFADRFTESMQEDSMPVMMMARLPRLHTPWLTDLRNASRYAPVFGRFLTMSEFVDLAAGQASAISYDEGEYLSPYLIQSAVLKLESPVTTPARLHQLRAQTEATATLNALATILRPSEAVADPANDQRLHEFESSLLEEETPVRPEFQLQQLDQLLDSVRTSEQQTCARLLQLIGSPRQNTRGVCLLNPLPWKRQELILWPDDYRPPAQTAAVAEGRVQDRHLQLLTNVPATGFTWLTEAGENPLRPEKAAGKPLAEPLLLRNQHFEVVLSDTTGGIKSITFHNQRANRLSQQLAYRYEHPQQVVVDDQQTPTSYATPRLVSSRVLQTGPVVGQIETTCEIRDVVSDDLLAAYRQIVTLNRFTRRIHLQIEFDDVPRVPVGNPWMTYLASRFAWENESAAITRGMLGQVRGFRMERFESPDFVEIADSDTRVVIVPHGRPYHRRSGYRMLDSLLIVEGEVGRQFEFTLDFDHPYPSRVAAEVLNPMVVEPVADMAPAKADSSWVMGLSAKNVQIARCRTLSDAESTRLVLLLSETEGRAARCAIHTARPPRLARLRRPDGQTVADLTVQDGSVVVDFSRFQIRELELTF